MNKSMRMVACVLLMALIGGVSAWAFAPHAAEPVKSSTFDISHGLVVKDIPKDAKKVRVWFWIPDDDEAQKTASLTITEAPAHYLIVKEPLTGSRYFYAEVDQPAGNVAIQTSFVVTRKEMTTKLDPKQVGPLTDADRVRFAEYLRKDTPYMEVNDRIQQLANKLCGEDTNVVTQMRKIYDYVVENSDHYSKAGAPKNSDKGSVEYCLDMKGGGCTDQHATVIALARARGIPTRLHFGSRLQAKNEGKEVDPGYRCWVQYYVPNTGWVAMDASAGDTTAGAMDYYFSGIDQNRVRFAEGRDLDIGDKKSGRRVNLIIGAYVEVDGAPHTAFDRKMVFTQVKAPAVSAR